MLLITRYASGWHDTVLELTFIGGYFLNYEYIPERLCWAFGTHGSLWEQSSDIETCGYHHCGCGCAVDYMGISLLIQIWKEHLSEFRKEFGVTQVGCIYIDLL